MHGFLELLGGVLATAYAVYGFVFLFLPVVLFAHVPVLAAVLWVVLARGSGRRAWPFIPARVRWWTRLGVETAYGLVNPVIYLAVLAPTLPLVAHARFWPLTMSAWILLFAFWGMRLAGAALDPQSRTSRAVVRAVLWAGLFCVLVHAAKDEVLLFSVDGGRVSRLTLALIAVRVCPLYLIPAVLLWDYARGMALAGPTLAGNTAGPGDSWNRLFLLPTRAARVVTLAAVALAVVSAVLATYRQSDGAVRQLVAAHRASIQEASKQYDVDPRLLGAIVYVVHRDQLSPFRGALERVAAGAWANNLRAQLGLLPPDSVEDVGTDENPLLDVALDLSLGLAQVKPRTAQTASVLASGVTPDELPGPVRYGYRAVEPSGDAWKRPAERRRALPSPIPVPASRARVTQALLDARTNLAVAALILALYQQQWETADPAWRLRERPDILATLYQIGFAKSRPHAAPRSNAFGARVGEVTREQWLVELFPR